MKGGALKRMWVDFNLRAGSAQREGERGGGGRNSFATQPPSRSSTLPLPPPNQSCPPAVQRNEE